MPGKLNDVCENRLTERWNVEDYTDEYWDRELFARMYV